MIVPVGMAYYDKNHISSEIFLFTKANKWHVSIPNLGNNSPIRENLVYQTRYTENSLNFLDFYISNNIMQLSNLFGTTGCGIVLTPHKVKSICLKGMRKAARARTRTAFENGNFPDVNVRASHLSFQPYKPTH